MLSIVLLTNFYSGQYYSIITLPTYESTIETVDDFLRAIDDDNKYYLIVSRVQMTDYLKANMSNYLEWRIGKYLKK